jgi:hypothetical protein
MSVEWIHKFPIHLNGSFRKRKVQGKAPKVEVKCGEFEGKSAEMSFVHFTRLLVLL